MPTMTSTNPKLLAVLIATGVEVKLYRKPAPSGDMIPSYSGCFVDAVNPNPFSSIKKLNQSFLPLYFLPSI